MHRFPQIQTDGRRIGGGPRGPQESSSGEEDEEEIWYLVNLLGGEPKEGGNGEGVTPPQGGAVAGPSREGHQAVVKELEEGERDPQVSPAMGNPLPQRGPGEGNSERRGQKIGTMNGRPRDTMPGCGNCSPTAQKASPWMSTRGSRSLAGG